MFRLIYRQRRRLWTTGFFFILALACKLIAMGPDFVTLMFGPTLLNYAIAAVAFGIVIALVLLVCGLFIVALPYYRLMPEQIAVMLFLLALFDIMWPGHADVVYIGGIIPIIAFFVIYSVCYGEFLDRFPGWVNYSATRRFRSAKSPQDLWPLIIGDDLELTIDEITRDPETPDIMRVKRQLGAGIYAMTTRTILRNDAPHHYAYRFEGDATARNKAITSGTYSIQITPRADGGSTVAVTETHDAMLWRVGFQMWLDDAIGSLADHMSAYDKGRSDWSTEGRTRRKIKSLA